MDERHRGRAAQSSERREVQRVRCLLPLHCSLLMPAVSQSRSLFL